MKCPICKKQADTLEARTRDDGVVRRRYECFNLHRFTTLEVAVLNTESVSVALCKTQPKEYKK